MDWGGGWWWGAQSKSSFISIYGDPGEAGTEATGTLRAGITSATVPVPGKRCSGRNFGQHQQLVSVLVKNVEC